MEIDNLKLSNQLCFKIYSVSKAMTRLYKPILDSLNLTYPQYLVMLILWEHEKISFKDMSNNLKMKTGTLTPILNKLESQGQLCRVKDEDDERKVYIQITSKGEKLKYEASNVPGEISCRAQIKMDEYVKYMREFDELLKKLDEIENYRY
ncbi:MarR family transcriptional regulator [Clostridium tagluense]|uniref:MarR family winged helix-turn-helix transcriptional regulator n=1 Tax=Clostridium tagluense TaxID=360422 RepID=UPI001C0C90CF|nr:MarR family transcriptional regulator [Clostridium tagluense]MBU3128240.1 MarR family transcriptional regulator [Clostridium tagluense]MCB2314088.1 MarR family transcriptional regulator [Clostridium tagluense]MCB2318925.1 MarR family transcriptional regulator [Clostridium tagluense]MCB2323830.1 MarR family transcriptional regulator [Clostridium tagluense]MCB2328646.1 MarR family transcriptional regulator [Clostridium tagluense]